MSKPFAVVLLSTVLLCACSTPSGEGTAEALVEHSEKEATTEGLKLDNGQRWKVSPHMVEPIQRMQVRIAEAQAIPLEQRDPKALADSLFVDIDQLVVACDMQGKAHDVLHEWLMPHIQLVQDLERTTDQGAADSLLEALANSSAVYDSFFE
jgi:hypothetical protein